MSHRPVPGMCVLFDVLRANEAVGAMLRRALEPTGLTPTGYAVLSVVDALGRTTPTEVAESIGAKPSTLTAHLARLVDQGLISRTPGADGRSVDLGITDRGRRTGGAKLDAGTVPQSESYISRSDHAAFHERGVQAAFATDGANFRTPYYHTPEDVPAHIVQPFLVRAVRTLVAGTIGMAGRPAACGG